MARASTSGGEEKESLCVRFDRSAGCAFYRLQRRRRRLRRDNNEEEIGVKGGRRTYSTGNRRTQMATRGGSGRRQLSCVSSPLVSDAADPRFFERLFFFEHPLSSLSVIPLLIYTYTPTERGRLSHLWLVLSSPLHTKKGNANKSPTATSPSPPFSTSDDVIAGDNRR